MKKVNIAFCTAMLFLIASCKKEYTTEKVETKTEIDPTKIYKTPSTPEEKLFVENLGKVTDIFKELYKDNSNLKLVNAAIFSKAYSDESVLLKDLIYPVDSWLSTVTKFKAYVNSWNVSHSKFAENFWAEVRKKNDPDFLQFLEGLNSTATSNLIETNNTNPVSVYFPYSVEFPPPPGETYQPITSIVTATADADEGWGSLPYYVNGVFQYNIQVLVNDDYVAANPTHIIGFNGIEPTPDLPEPPPPPPPPPGISRVYVGEGICKVQYDRLISFTGNGGGSEIKYCRLSAYLQPVNGHVTTFQDIASVNFSRSTIKNKNWKWVYTVWDDDWAQGELEQIFGIYEEDNTNSRTFSGSLVTTTGGGTGTIGYTVTVQSQDDIIRQLKISRNSYFTAAFQNQGKDFSPDATFLPLPYTHGWPAYDVHYWNKSGANVGWTWPYNTL